MTDRIEKARERAYEIIQQRGLCGCMNNTKWNELRTAMLNEMPFPPRYVVKYLFEDEAAVAAQAQLIGKDAPYMGDWDEGFDPDGFFAIEWVMVRPRYLKHRGRLVPPKVVDAGEKFVEILKRYSINYEESDGAYRIYGYR